MAWLRSLKHGVKIAFIRRVKFPNHQVKMLQPSPKIIERIPHLHANPDSVLNSRLVMSSDSSTSGSWSRWKGSPCTHPSLRSCPHANSIGSKWHDWDPTAFRKIILLRGVKLLSVSLKDFQLLTQISTTFTFREKPRLVFQLLPLSSLQTHVTPLKLSSMCALATPLTASLAHPFWPRNKIRRDTRNNHPGLHLTGTAHHTPTPICNLLFTCKSGLVQEAWLKPLQYRAKINLHGVEILGLCLAGFIWSAYFSTNCAFVCKSKLSCSMAALVLNSDLSNFSLFRWCAISPLTAVLVLPLHAATHSSWHPGSTSHAPWLLFLDTDDQVLAALQSNQK